ncbi:PilZ domain-containing protein [Glaciecola sp. XM2]|jgi:hypothetical protein|uniref:PilZ domain-containing protein n=1 Tax=Glaciecola sp. XM2 TaxID=1914931 RepID=UPI001BDF3B4D|nr:PilZ domain-containing protein [Glaciecola sp. XM2]MBT1449742.1 PilZ domain-containing protein [Glaciecola sp. XM2]
MNALTDKLEQFNAFYLIAHPLRVNVEPASDEQIAQSLDQFEESMPYAFRISSEMSEIEAQALRPFRNMGEKFDELVNYLQLQARKMDLMMSYILLQQDTPELRRTAIKFGGGGVVLPSQTDVELGSHVILKLFLETEAAAIYCMAQAVESQTMEDGFAISYAYTHIREQDQELLVRASLHLQTAQLRKSQSN